MKKKQQKKQTNNKTCKLVNQNQQIMFILSS